MGVVLVDFVSAGLAAAGRGFRREEEGTSPAAGTAGCFFLVVVLVAAGPAGFAGSFLTALLPLGAALTAAFSSIVFCFALRLVLFSGLAGADF